MNHSHGLPLYLQPIDMAAIRPSISSLQKELISDFQTLQDYPQTALDHLIELGKTLPAFPTSQRNKENLVPGCLARVWLTHTHRQGRIFFQGDSEAMTTKGLLALLIHIFSGQRSDDILSSDLSFIQAMQLPQLLGSQRRAGLGSMVTHIKKHAATYIKAT